MAKFVHFDEARDAVLGRLRAWLQGWPSIDVVFITDLQGKFRVILSSLVDVADLLQALTESGGGWWSGDIKFVQEVDPFSSELFRIASLDARPDEKEPRLKLVERHRSRTAWFARPIDGAWLAPEEGPPIVVFYSFKGGMGRSTLLAAFAIQRARAGQRVCVVDYDLDSPGIGRLLSADMDGLTANWGVVDFLLEHRLSDVDFGDYWHRCDRVSGDGQILVMPSGKLDEFFVDKLARVDLEESPSANDSGLWRLLDRIKVEQRPDWVLLDARTGLSEPAGQLLSGIAHAHVLLSSVQEQSWLGIDRIVERLGRERLLDDRAQAEIILVQAMVPVGDAGKISKNTFDARAQETFESCYYGTEGDERDDIWTVEDMQSQDAPHAALHIDYEQKLASFSDVSEVEDMLCSGIYEEIGQRILGKFVVDDLA